MDKTEKIENLWLRLANPVQCHLWQKTALVREDLAMDVVLILIEESHLERAIMRCSQCGQCYFCEWYEEIDWDGGDDKMYTTYIPIQWDENLINALKQRSPFELLAVTPRLQWDNGGEIKWIGK